MKLLKKTKQKIKNSNFDFIIFSIKLAHILNDIMKSILTSETLKKDILKASINSFYQTNFGRSHFAKLLYQDKFKVVSQLNLTSRKKPILCLMKALTF